MSQPGSLPEPLAHALAEAHAALAHDSAGALPRGARETIWAALGPDELGRRRRTYLAIAAAEHVLADWERRFPNHDLPHTLLSLARGVLDGTVGRERASAEYGRATTHIDDLVIASSEKVLASTPYAAAQALATALFDETFDPVAPRRDLHDDQLEPDAQDAAYLASVVRAGGPAWLSGASPVRRRDFWTWWLNEAVPRAYVEGSR